MKCITWPKLLLEMTCDPIGCKFPELPQKRRFNQVRLFFFQATGDDANDWLFPRFANRSNSLCFGRIASSIYMHVLSATAPLAIVELLEISRININIDVVVCPLNHLTPRPSRESPAQSTRAD